MDNQGKLPPLPPSDASSLARNHYDGFYKRTSRDVWGENEIIYIKDEPMKKCQHYFEQKGLEFICKKCHFGLMNGIGLTVSDGKLFYENVLIPLGG